MQYFKNLFGSFTSPHTYQAFMNAPTRRALGHFALSMFLIGAVQGFLLVRNVYPQLISGVEENLDSLIAAYPADLSITWDGQQLTTNPAEYHLLIMNASALPLFHDSSANEIVVYTNADLTAQQASETLDTYGAAAVVDQHSLFYTTPETGMSEEALADYLGDRHLSLTKDALPVLRTMAVDMITKFQSLALWAGPIILALILVAAQLLSSLVLATILYLPAKVLGMMQSWTQSWRFTLVLLVVIQIITIVTGLLYPATTFPVHTAAFWLLAAFILISLKLSSQKKK